MQETWVWSLVREDPLEKKMATHSSILAWRIPWTEEPSGLQSMGLQRVGHDWATSLSLFTLTFHTLYSRIIEIPCSPMQTHFFFNCNVDIQLLSHIRLFATPWTAAHQASLFFTISWLMSMESVMPSNHLVLCCSLLLLPSIFPSIWVFSSESVLRIRWPKYWSFSISPFSEYSNI